MSWGDSNVLCVSWGDSNVLCVSRRDSNVFGFGFILGLVEWIMDSKLGIKGGIGGERSQSLGVCQKEQ